MITNREEILTRAFQVFLKMNYERASFTTLAAACGLTKTAITYYFPRKLDLFIAVTDKFLLNMQDPANKFSAEADSLSGFIEVFVAGVRDTMQRIISLVGSDIAQFDCSPNFYYFHFISQARMYYPGFRDKFNDMLRMNQVIWEKYIRLAKESGEIRSDVDVEKTALIFKRIFFGISYEQAFLNGLDIDNLKESLNVVYSLIKAEQ